MFGDKLRILRKNRNLSQKDLGKQLGMAFSTISGYEMGTRMPDLDKLKKIADFFEVSVDYLLDRETNMNLNEKEFLNDVDKLSIEDLKAKYKIVIDDISVSDEELLGAISWIKTNRQLKNKK